MPDLHSAPAAYADDETVDTDFVHHLVRGAELLQVGDAAQAQHILERALQLRPKNQRGQNLLALSYFKLGLFDRAEGIYRALIADHPADPTLRVNLGLVQLKTGRADDAALAFSAALELQPEHPKAQSYLGLAHLHRRDYALARQWFEKAGNVVMAERAQRQAEAGQESLSPVEVEVAAPEPLEATPLRAPGAFFAARPDLEARTPALDAAPIDLATLTSSRRVEALHAAPFGVSPTLVVVEVQGELFTRVEGLVASFGPLELKPAFKRFRGRMTDKPFGEEARRMLHVAGAGRLWLAREGRSFLAFEVGDEPAYFREEAIFAFEESLLFENGRVPSKLGGDLHLVHLRGKGAALLVSRQPPRSVDVTKGEPCRVPIEVLLGWHGNIAPRVVALAQEAEGATALPVVELSGEGRVLLDAALGS